MLIIELSKDEKQLVVRNSNKQLIGCICKDLKGTANFYCYKLDFDVSGKLGTDDLYQIIAKLNELNSNTKEP